MNRPPFALLTVGQLGELLGLSSKRVSNLASEIAAGRRPASDLPPARRLGGRRRWRLDEVEAWIGSHVDLENAHQATAQPEADRAEPGQPGPNGDRGLP